MVVLMPPDLPTRLARKWMDRFEKDRTLSVDAILEGAVREALEEAEKIVQSTGWFVWGPFGQGRVAAAIAALRANLPEG